MKVQIKKSRMLSLLMILYTFWLIKIQICFMELNIIYYSALQPYYLLAVLTISMSKSCYLFLQCSYMQHKFGNLLAYQVLGSISQTKFMSRILNNTLGKFKVKHQKWLWNIRIIIMSSTRERVKGRILNFALKNSDMLNT